MTLVLSGLKTLEKGQKENLLILLVKCQKSREELKILTLLISEKNFGVQKNYDSGQKKYKGLELGDERI